MSVKISGDSFWLTQQFLNLFTVIFRILRRKINVNKTYAIAEIKDICISVRLVIEFVKFFSHDRHVSIWNKRYFFFGSVNFQ